MSLGQELTDQIADLLGDRALLLGALMGDEETATRWASHARAQGAHLAGLLGTAGTADAHAVAELVRSLVSLEWGEESPPSVDWWRSPLGRAAAGSMSADPVIAAERMSAIIAADMLGISRQRVMQLLKTGKLEPHPEGGVTRASVLARLAA